MLTRNAVRRLLAAGAPLFLSAVTVAELPSDAPPLPPPDPGTYNIVNVSTQMQLLDAFTNAQSGDAIVIAAGTYDISGAGGGAGLRLISLVDVQVRGATGDPADVVLDGGGVSQTGIFLFETTDALIADLSIRDAQFHCIQVSSSTTPSHRARLYHLALSDSGEQLVKASSGADGGVVEYCELSYSSDACGSALRGGVEVQAGEGWIVRDNLFRNIRCTSFLSPPAVRLWSGSSDTLVELNTFLDNARDVGLGVLSTPGDHTGGIVRNNFLRHEASPAYPVDVPIFSVSEGSEILHNSLMINGSVSAAIQLRWSHVTSAVVRGNLLDSGSVQLSNGAAATVTDNVTGATAAWFVSEATGDLHLTNLALPAIDQLDRLANAVENFDRETRPAGSGETDAGADELVVEPGTGFCFGSSGCPCGNDSGAGGCLNSGGGGAVLSGAGSSSVSADDLVLTVSGIPSPNANGILFTGPSMLAPFVPTSADGFACTGGGLRFPGILDDGVPPNELVQAAVVSTAAAGGLTIASGETWHFQGWFRDNNGSPCGGSSNLSNAYSVTFGP